MKQRYSIFILVGMLSACGGGGSSSNNISHKLDGVWDDGCNSSGNGDYIVFTIKGDLIEIDAKGHNFSDCSGALTDRTIIKGFIDYKGNFATSSCMAEKINITYDEITYNGVKLTTEQVEKGLKALGTPVPLYQIACKTEGFVYFGLITKEKDGSSNAKRPIEMDFSD